MMPGKFVVEPCIFNSNYCWFMCVFAILKLLEEYDCITHLLIFSRETDWRSAFVSDCVMTCMIGGFLFPPLAQR
jgi:hypothetical protein